jgi:hypothetical protein
MVRLVIVDHFLFTARGAFDSLVSLSFRTVLSLLQARERIVDHQSHNKHIGQRQRPWGCVSTNSCAVFTTCSNPKISRVVEVATGLLFYVAPMPLPKQILPKWQHATSRPFAVGSATVASLCTFGRSAQARPPLLCGSIRTSHKRVPMRLHPVLLLDESNVVRGARGTAIPHRGGRLGCLDQDASRWNKSVYMAQRRQRSVLLLRGRFNRDPL